jgi:phosphoribosylformylglycinamidine synthase
MMLSESQERMLMVLKPEKEPQCRAIFEKWDLEFAIVGETIKEDLFIIEHDGEIKAQVPLKALSGNSPEYDRPWVVPSKPKPLPETQSISPIEGLQSIISSPNYCSKKWVFQQYDSQVMADTIIIPGTGAGLVRVHGTKKDLAFTADVTPRYVKADPFEGGKQAVAEAFRNLCAVGATPIASTDNLNFGNPEKPEIMGQLVLAIEGIAEAAEKLEMPIVSGNVSLYNETDGEPILPTPTIGAVGLIGEDEKPILNSINEGDLLLTVGLTFGHLGQSAIIDEMFGLQDGTPPKVDLQVEKQNGFFILNNRHLINACTDLSDGGIALAAFELAEKGNLGIEIDITDTATLFGEDQARYLIACNFDQAELLFVRAREQNVTINKIGILGGDEIKFGEFYTHKDRLFRIFRDTFDEIFN